MSVGMLYEPVRKNRLFAVGLKYSDVNWDCFADVLSAFERRIDQWYLAPVRLLRDQLGQHGAFAALSICCLLIDCLCQFEAGKVTSNRDLFIKFIKKRLPHYRRTVNPPIEFPKVDTRNCVYETDAMTGAIRTRQLKNIADVLYYVYRNGILHSAHAPLCGVISGIKNRRFAVTKKSLATYRDIGPRGAPCPVVVIDPWKLFSEIERVFQRYLARLKASKETARFRRRFNTKFSDSFGMNITAAR